MKAILWMLVTIFCLTGAVATASRKNSDKNEYEIESEREGETVDEENGNLIDAVVNEDNDAEEAEEEGYGSEGNRCGDAFETDSTAAPDVMEEEQERKVNDGASDVETEVNAKSQRDDRTTEGGSSTYNVRDEKSCRMRKNSEKLSKIIRKTRSEEKRQREDKEATTREKSTLQNQQKGEKSVKERKVRMSGESFKQISKKANSGKYKKNQQQQKEKSGGKYEQKGGKKQKKKSQTGSSKKSQKTDGNSRRGTKKSEL